MSVLEKAGARSPERAHPPPSPSREELRTRVHAAVARGLEIEESSIDDGTRFIHDLEVDSIAVLDILCALEEELGLEIDEVQALPVETVGQLVEVLAESPLYGEAVHRR